MIEAFKSTGAEGAVHKKQWTFLYPSFCKSCLEEMNRKFTVKEKGTASFDTDGYPFLRNEF